MMLIVAIYIILPLNATKADVFQWEYLAPGYPAGGKQQSTTLCPDGAGVDAVAGAHLQFRNLTMAYLDYYNLTMAYLMGADFSNASFFRAQLTGADFSGAEIRGADFGRTRLGDESLIGTGVTLAQLYSTASYQAHDLSGISLADNDLAGAMLAGQNLRDADFYGATLTDADFSGADVKGASFGVHFCDFCSNPSSGITPTQLYSTSSYQAQDLIGIGLPGNILAGANFAGHNLTGADLSLATLTDVDFRDANLINADFNFATLSNANFRQANLSAANLAGATLTGADFTRANVRGASLDVTGVVWPHGGGMPSIGFGTGITLAQLYSTASYQALDLSGISVWGNNFAGANFAGQNIANVQFGTATLTGADFTGADVRGADLQNLEIPASAITTNLIRPDGHVNGLDLNVGRLLVVRDYDGDPDLMPTPLLPIEITVDQHFVMEHGSTLRIVFEADAWDSTISFAPSIPVTLGGTLELGFADDLNPASQIGRTFDIFDWTGVHPTGAFAVSSRYHWDLSNLYTTGEATLIAIPEPASLILLALAAASFVALRQRFSVRRLSLAKIIIIVTACAIAPLAAHAASLRTVALSGQHAPGTPDGVNFMPWESAFGIPVLNNMGQVAFWGRLNLPAVDSSNDGIWSEGSGSLALVAREGDNVPGIGTFSSFDWPVINDVGHTAFVARNANGWATWVQRTGGLVRVGASSNNSHISLNNAGHSAFSNGAIWSEGSGNLVRVAGIGDPAPGTPEGVKFHLFPTAPPPTPPLNSLGKTAFRGVLAGNGANATNDEGIWSQGSGSLALVARGGDPAPGTPSGVVFGPNSFGGIFSSDVALNDNGHTAFRGFLTGDGVSSPDSHGIFAESDSGLRLVARTGDHAPGTPAGVNFQTLVAPVLNDAGQTAFLAFHTGDGYLGTRSGIWWEPPQGLTLVARSGDHAPGTPDGVVFISGSDSAFNQPLLNNSGQIAFFGRTNYGRGIWATDRSGTLQLIAREGDLLEVAPGDIRRILELGFASSVSVYPGDRSFNDRGQIVFCASFSGDTSGIFVSNAVAVPEPTAKLLSACCALIFFAFPKRFKIC
jgi:uncharacterized protein YjbI with pentapeptide repeats